MKAHREVPRHVLTPEQRAQLHPTQIEMLEQPIHFGRFGVLHGDFPNLELEPNDRDTCSYCGSITIDDAIKAMETPGVEYSGSDWKYGWPHKFYFEIPCEPYERIVGSSWENGKRTDERAICDKRHYKFYSRHLIDATPEQIERWNRVAAPLLGVRFELGAEGDLKYSAPPANSFYGFQVHGVVGVTVPG